ncbi:MAG: divergent PAP2 family protein [Lachnospiraceae bacterium]|jgi:acid phosphatase family membrane protein YuiD|nr:divergent PAP2 family protein [Lachnospiraceae bacterium]
MNDWELLIGNRLLISAVTGWFVAQVLKTLIHAWVTKSFDPERLVGSGGMPSSHASTVCAMATTAGRLHGLGSPVFAVTVILAIIVMHDAMGVRLETGKQAKLLNQIVDSFKTLEGKKLAEEKLKEFVGHTPIQVIMGALLGILIGWLTG